MIKSFAEGRKILEEKLGKKTLKDYMREVIPQAGDIELLKAFAASYLFDVSPRQSIPEVFSLPDIISDSFKNTRSVLLDGFGRDPFSFIRFGTFAVKSFNEFKVAYDSCSFPFRHPEISIALVISILQTSEQPENNAFLEAKTAVEKLGVQGALFNKDQFLKIRNAVLYYQVITHQFSRPNDKMASETVRKIKALIVDQKSRMILYKSFFTGQVASGIKANEFLTEQGISTRYSSTETRAWDTAGNRARLDERLTDLGRVTEMASSLDPVDLICADYRLKAEHRKNKKENSDYKDTDYPLELGAVFNTLIAMLSRVKSHEYVAVFLPSPEFIRKWLDDKMLVGINIVFIVASYQESVLWQIQTGTAKRTEDWKPECKANSYEKREEIAFYSLQEFVSNYDVRKASFGLSVVFSSEKNGKDFLSPVLSDLIKERRLGSEILCFGSDLSLKSKASFFTAINKSNNYKIESILFMPDNLNIASPKSKNLWYAKEQASGSPKRDVRWRGEVSSDEHGTLVIRNQWKFIKSTVGEIPIPELGRKSLRKQIETEYLAQNKKFQIGAHSGERLTREPIEFVPGIPVHYSYSINDSGKITVHAYVTDGKAKVQNSDGSTILENESEIESWIRDEFPYMKKTKRNVTEGSRSVYIHDVIAEAYKIQYRGKPICLKTLLYIHMQRINEDIKKDIKSRSEDALRILVSFSESEYGEKNLETIMPEDMVDFLNDTIHDSDAIIGGVRALSISLDIAKREGNIDINPAKAFLADEDRRRKAMLNIRSKLAMKSLPMMKMRELVSSIKKKVDGGEPIYAGVMIKALTGLETRTICALQWRDFIQVPLFSFYQLLIYKRLSDENKLETFENELSFRCIPCAETLTSVLNTVKSHLEKNGMYNGNSPIVIESYSDTKSFSRRTKLTEAIRNMVNSLGLKRQKLFLDDETTTDLTEYNGDFLRSNFRYMAQDIAKMNHDEIAYILGNNPETVLEKHYIDNARDTSQLALYTKLRRIDSIISAVKGRPYAEKEFVITDDWGQGPSEIAGLQKVSVTAPVDIDQDYEIEIESDFGVYLDNGDKNGRESDSRKLE